MSLADARALAGRHRSRIEAGEDPHDEKLQARKQERELARQLAEAQHLDVERTWEKYMQLVASQLRSRDEKDRVFRRYILPTVTGKCVTEIPKAHALKIIDSLVAQDKRRMADKVRQEGAAFFQWLLEREHVDRNVFSGIRKANPRKTIRTRVLSDAEQRQIWLAREVEGRWSLWIKLLILTGCRNMEVRAARWSEFDNEARLWTIRPSAPIPRTRCRAIRRSRTASELSSCRTAAIASPACTSASAAISTVPSGSLPCSQARQARRAASVAYAARMSSCSGSAQLGWVSSSMFIGREKHAACRRTIIREHEIEMTVCHEPRAFR